MKKRPFFSIAIPTYNNPLYLEKLIKSILRQDFKDFEIIVTDNSNNSKTENLCRSLKDNRIIYIKNRENIGFTRNLYKAIRNSKGKYVLSMGDDDLLLETDLLKKTNDLIKIHGYGYIRIRFVYTNKKEKLFSIYFNSFANQDLITVGRNKSDYEVDNFINKSIYSFMSGLIFKNDGKFLIKEIENAKNSTFELSNFWIKYLFDSVKKNGGCIYMNKTIIANWPNYKNPRFFEVVNNRLREENIWDLYLNKKNKKQFSMIMADHINMLSHSLLISIKYYSNNLNLIRYTRRLTELQPKLKSDPTFYTFLFLALLMPKALWALIRSIYQNSLQIKNSVLVTKYERLLKDINN